MPERTRDAGDNHALVREIDLRLIGIDLSTDEGRIRAKRNWDHLEERRTRAEARRALWRSSWPAIIIGLIGALLAGLVSAGLKRAGIN